MVYDISFSSDLLNMTISGSIHVAANGIISFFYGLVVFHCMYIPHLLYLFICPWTLFASKSPSV